MLGKIHLRCCYGAAKLGLHLRCPILPFPPSVLDLYALAFSTYEIFQPLKAQKFFDKGYIINGPRLQRLTLRDMEVCMGANYFEFLLRPLPQLTHLDLSGEDLGCCFNICQTTFQKISKF